MNSHTPILNALNLGMVAGEASGDLLGGDLLHALSQKIENIQSSGIGGQQLQQAGLQNLYPMERLSVMGFSEVLSRLPELLLQRHRLFNELQTRKIELFVGVDAPDYNLGLEKKFKSAGVPVAHYVSPSVWAWREKRLNKIKESVDLMLCLFPFEKKFYDEKGVQAYFVGHPLANRIPMMVNSESARKVLGLDENKKVIALLPGSRKSEIKRLWHLMLETADRVRRQLDEVLFVVPAATPELFQIMQKELHDYNNLDIKIVHKQSHEAMAAADVICLASGTAALEAMLIKRPTVITYKVSSMTAMIAKKLLTVEYVSLPNNLAGEALFPEFLQEQAQPELIANALLKQLTDKDVQHTIIKKSEVLHRSLQCEKGIAADVLINYLVENNKC